TARLFRPQRCRDRRYRRRLHRRHRLGQTPLADPQQRLGGAAGIHPRPGPKPPVSAPMPGVRVLLRNPGFIALLTYRLLSMFSAQIVAVTVGWHIYQLTADPFALGLVGLA